MKQFFVLSIFISTIFSNILLANTFKSGENKVTLMELYTSQGCSSCPPADKWLSNLIKEETLFKKFIPLAFHVSYWDYIGWNDIFATKINDNRQRTYSKEVWKKNSVYTPQFIIDTKEYRQWFKTKDLPSFSNNYAGNLEVNLDKINNIKINYSNKNIQNKDVIINIALLGFNYSIPIKSGENSHKILKHDFVVLQHIQKSSKIRNNKLEYKTKLLTKKDSKRKEALVVWISDRNHNQLQAVGNYIKK
jgi:hypothetical protein